MILTDDINTVVFTALTSQSGVLAGSAFPNRGPDTPAAYPYVVFRIDAQDAENYSGPIYVQHWRVRVAAYSALGTTPAAQDIQKALATALVVVGAPVVTTLRNANETVLHSLPMTGEEDYDPTLREGKDILVASLTCDLLVQGDRSVA